MQARGSAVAGTWRRVQAGLTAAVLSSGCVADRPPVQSAPYAGPTITVQVMRGQHVLVLSAPSPGWTLSLDAARREFAHDEVFVSVREPSPAIMRAPRPVRQELATEVDAARPLRVFARVLRHDQPEDGPAYQPVSHGPPP